MDLSTRSTHADRSIVAHVQVAIVGSGFAGLGAGICLKREGVHDFLIFERAKDVGGTWRDNSYPGCACDVESQVYSFSFAPNPDWSRSFSPQPEIYAYLRRVADEYGLQPHTRFDHNLDEARWDEDRKQWRVVTSQGVYTADVLICGQGGLSDPKLPDIAGIERFEGKLFHSARWDHDYDLAGRNVAVIGTGASAIQFVPAIQPKVHSLKLFQRTPAWVMPRLDRGVTRFERAIYRALPVTQRAMRGLTHLRREAYIALFRNPRWMGLAQFQAKQHLERQIKDPTLRQKLTPNFVIGCKRILLSNDYYPALAQPNVDVITTGIKEVRAHSIVTTDGVEHPVDAIILGTGFETTEPPIAKHLYGRKGISLAAEWDGSPQAHLGTMVAGYPNLFLMTGPNTGLGHSSIVLMIEAQLQLVTNALRQLRATGNASIEPRPEAQAKFNDYLQERLRTTVWNQGGCSSWYLDRNGRNSVLWPDTTMAFRRMLATLRLDDYVLSGRVSAQTSKGAPQPNLHAA